MFRNRGAALFLSTGVAVLTLAACSESITPPGAPTGMAPGDAVTPPGAAVAGQIQVCKLGDVSGTVSVSGTPFGSGGTGFTTVSGGSVELAPGECVELARDESPQGSGTNATVSETSPDADSVTVTCIDNGGNPCNADAPLSLNIIHGYLITYTNHFEEEPPVEQCTFTKGWYRNNGEDTVSDDLIDGLTADEARAIFDATPGKPGDVTFTSNDLLNLTQQLLAAIQNGGMSGPDEVQDAIDDAVAEITITGLAITTTLSKSEISELIETLSSYNEGEFEGFPHCDDEIIHA